VKSRSTPYQQLSVCGNRATVFTQMRNKRTMTLAIQTNRDCAFGEIQIADCTNSFTASRFFDYHQGAARTLAATARATENFFAGVRADRRNRLWATGWWFELMYCVYRDIDIITRPLYLRQVIDYVQSMSDIAQT